MDKIVHPILDEEITFLKTSRQTNGEITQLDVLLGPKGGNPLHYHKRFSESFKILEGELSIQLGKEKFILKQGESATVPINTTHRFYNQSGKPVRFICELRPASESFENTLRIVCGLYRDGKTGKDGFPKRFIESAITMNMTESYMTGLFSILEKFIFFFGKTKKAKSIEKGLIEKYCR
jgi:mannose-6-phosphate isomerase-like protein (cupin superfamily)